MTAVVVVIALLLAGSGTVAAAGNSMPDEPLYPVKLATETVRLTLTPSALGKAELYVKLADKRVAEIIKMADKGKVKQVENAAERLNTQLIAMASLAVPGGEDSRSKRKRRAWRSSSGSSTRPSSSSGPRAGWRT